MTTERLGADEAPVTVVLQRDGDHYRTADGRFTVRDTCPPDAVARRQSRTDRRRWRAHEGEREVASAGTLTEMRGKLVQLYLREQNAKDVHA